MGPHTNMGGIPLSGCCACPKPGSGFRMSYVVVFLCSVSSVKMRGDCSFCWYWWNWWQSSFKLRDENKKKRIRDTEAQSACILPPNSKQVVVHCIIYLSCCVVYVTGRDRRCRDLTVVVQCCQIKCLPVFSSVL